MLTPTERVLDCHDGCPDDAGKIEPGRCGCGVADTPIQGDFDCDGDFDLDDHAAMENALGLCPGDMNGDGRVDGQDLGLLFVVWGTCF